MDAETEKKLTEQQHQIDLLKEKIEGNMKAMKAENESAIDRLQLSNEKAIGALRTDNEKAIGALRTDHEKAIGELRSTIFIQMISVATLVVAVVGVFIAYLQFFK